MVRRIIHREAPDLHLRAHERGYARRVLRQRIARDVAPRVLDAALAGEGINLTPAAVDAFHRAGGAYHVIVAALSVGLAAEHGLVHGLLCRGVELREPLAVARWNWSASLWASSVTSSAVSRAREIANMERGPVGQASSTLFLTACAGVASMTACGVWVRSAA